MSSNLLRFLNDYWEVEHRPRHDLHRVEDEMVNLSAANIFYIVVTIFLFTVTALFVGGGML